MADRSNFNVLLRQSEVALIRGAADRADGGSISRFSNRVIPQAVEREFLNVLRDNYRDHVLPSYTGSQRQQICISLTTRCHSILEQAAEGMCTKAEVFRWAVTNAAMFERTADGIPGLPNALTLSPLVSIRVPRHLDGSKPLIEAAMYRATFGALAAIMRGTDRRTPVERVVRYMAEDARKVWFGSKAKLDDLVTIPGLDARPINSAATELGKIFHGAPYELWLSWLTSLELHSLERRVSKYVKMPRRSESEDD